MHGEIAVPLLALIALISALVGGCAPESASLDWSVSFAEPSSRDEAVRVQAGIRAGGCDGATQYLTEITLAGTGAGDLPPVLPNGRYGFFARGGDDLCRWRFEGCVEVELPTDSPVIVTLADVTRAPDCEAARCVDGVCQEEPCDPLSPGCPVEPPVVSPPEPPVECDIDTSSDPLNCGDCGVVCGQYEYCVAGECVVPLCFDNTGDCDGNPDNGCESDLEDDESCGACGVVCDGGASCQDGYCCSERCPILYDCCPGDLCCPFGCDRQEGCLPAETFD